MTLGVCPYKMKVKKRDDAWWILGVADMDPEGMGPYPSKEEAEWHMGAVAKTWLHGDKPGYFTVDKPEKRAPVVLQPREPEPQAPKRRVRKPSTAVAAPRRKKRKSRKRK